MKHAGKNREDSPLERLFPPASEMDVQAVDIAVGAPRLEVVRLIASLLERRPDVTLRVLCAAPGDGIVPPASLDEGLTLSQNLSMELAAAWKERLISVFGRDVDGAPKTDARQEAIIELADMVEQGRIEFAFFDRELNFTRTLLLHTANGPASLLAHSGFTPSALEQAGELRSLQFGESARGVEAWFETMWGDAVDITPDVLELLVDSWACHLLTPRQAYRKVLVEYFSEMLETEDPLVDDNPMLEHLAEFQKHAYAHAKGILRRFGGVFISDVVGLGKTFIGLALLKHAVQVQHARPLIIAPPRLCDMWDELALDYGVEKEILSNYQLDKLDRYQNRDLVLIDESHAFRNEDTQRYEQLTEFLRPGGQPSRRKVILLTATPQNNTCWDVYNQLRFFPDVYGKLPFDGEDLGEFFKRVEYGRADLASLMQYVLVRRTRTFIKREYPDATLPGIDEDGNPDESPIIFPERRDGEDMALRYSIQDAYDGLYDDIIHTLKTLSYARYGLVDYLREGATDLPRYQNLVRAGRSLRGLFKATVLKRCESSLEAFKATLAWLIGTHRAFATALREEHRVVARPEHAGKRVNEMSVEDVLELFDASYPASDSRRGGWRGISNATLQNWRHWSGKSRGFRSRTTRNWSGCEITWMSIRPGSTERWFSRSTPIPRSICTSS